MLQEKKISSKINYEVLKSLNVNLNNSTKEQQKIEEPIQSPKKEINSPSSSKISSVSNSLETQDKPNTSVVKKPRVTKPQTPRKDEVQMPVEIETNTTESILPRVDTSLDMDETDDYVDEDVEADPTEMTVGEMLGHHGSEDENDFGYGYDEEDY
ncbi:hypothetical protein K0M31_011041 [Melipona bicolor]|uniref:Uncharacterized protein n=1 Tax=Melipona bicolor TaxID=60889 RepID=A0AA40FKK4_9HYME|nr:hypothetical protein K0M31_011041 [Melipona bicolor]